MSKGFVIIDRKIMDDWIWQGEFSKGQAWIDLILLANHSDKKVAAGSGFVEIKRGEFLTSSIKLANRWGWSRNKVERFLNVLKMDNKVTLKRTTKWTTVTLVNYDIYQFGRQQTEQQIDNKQTTNRQQIDTTKECIKNDKELKKDKSTKVDYEKIVDMFHTICVSYPQIRAVSDKRKRAIKSILNKYSLADVQTVFEKAEASDFLKGNNGGWAGASFDWLIKEANFIKTLEGNYDNKRSSTDVNDFFSSVADWVNERSNV